MTPRNIKIVVGVIIALLAIITVDMMFLAFSTLGQRCNTPVQASPVTTCRAWFLP